MRVRVLAAFALLAGALAVGPAVVGHDAGASSESVTVAAKSKSKSAPVASSSGRFRA